MNLIILVLLTALNVEPDSTVQLPPLAVSGRDIDTGSPQATSSLSGAEIDRLKPTHPAELFSRLPGAWITRGSGQEHLSAVRSPLLSGAGGCGALLILEDGIPIRPPGFCNVNNLFEVNLLQATEVRVLRGPGGLGHASGGLHGVIDFHTRSPLLAPVNRVTVETGSNDYYRASTSLTAELDNGALGIDASAVNAGSFREDEGYDHQFLTVSHAAPTTWGQWRTTLSAAHLDQDTAGFILGLDSYRDPVLRRQNLNPEAFRQATAVRLSSRAEWQGQASDYRSDHRLTAFARRSRMTFLQHFLPGKPLERNGQVSAGLQFDQRRSGQNLDVEWGLDAEMFRGFLFQRQDQPAEGSPFLVATRPVGRHYDYEVDGQRLGGYLAASATIAERWTWRAGVHADGVRYDYRTGLAAGNLAEDGNACGFGGCLYTRPEDRDDVFIDLAPELTLSRELDSGSLWLRLARGFRAPQATELYRLQSGQTVADLDSEVLDAIELGWRRPGRLSLELVAFAQRKENFIFRDAEGFNVSDGRTRHLGVEFETGWQIADDLRLAGRGTWARHTYRFDRDLGGETIISGRDIPSAPRRLWSADLTWTPGQRWTTQLAVERTGDYWLNAANTRRYSGHTLWHGVVEFKPAPGWILGFRARNLTGRRYAERADFAFGNYRYFPGAGRTLFINLGIDLQ